MKSPEYILSHRPQTPSGFSPYRLCDGEGREVASVNDFLDAQATRGLSPRSLRAYGYSLLNFWRWIIQDGRELYELEELDLLEYVRFQRTRAAEKNTDVAAKTINHRLTTVRCLYRFHCGKDLPAPRRAHGARSHPYYSSVASETGYLYPSRPMVRQFRVKTPRRVVVPLSTEQVRLFVESLRTWRDLGIASLMLFCGLRSREIIELELNDLSFVEAQVRIRGKGDKERIIPLPAKVLSLLRHYLDAERPKEASSQNLFVSLKGKKRGEAMSASGLRSLFRYHRSSSGVHNANPHRFRHTFGAEMVRAGICLPALMKLMGHGDVHTTIRYVELSPKEVREEFECACERLATELLAFREEEDEARP